MNTRYIFFILSLIGVTLSISSSINRLIYYDFTLKHNVEAHYIPKSLPNLIINYTDHDPIYIDGDKNFRNIARAEKWIGAGIQSSPYIIDRLRIIGPRHSNLIEIRNTDSYFFISNCILSGGNGGIYLSNVENGIISYMNVSNNFYGIFLNHSTNNIIFKSMFTRNSMEGIFFDNSKNNLIFNNTVTENLWTGIELWDSGGSNLTGNIVTNNLGSGIIFGRSGSCVVSSNNISDNKYTGIRLLDLERSIISDNFVSNNSLNGVSLGNASRTQIFNNCVTRNKWFGIRLYESDSNVFSNNTFSWNYRYGILFETSCTANKVIQNDFIRNYAEGSSQAFDDGKNNEFTSNYWDEWTNPDTNADGFVDLSYKIDGNAGNRDPHPVVSQYLVITQIPDLNSGRSNILTGLIMLIIILCTLTVLILKKRPM
ncbi:MAG: nitrous oxide reductase family maturation protein NosD [Promethearchaeota archaeon]